MASSCRVRPGPRLRQQQRARSRARNALSMPRSTKWAVDLTEPLTGVVREELPKPSGYSDQMLHDQDHKIEARKADQTKLKLKKAGELGYSPGKSFMMTAFMLWMSGSGVHIFSIMITFQALSTPAKSLFTVNSVFKRFDDPNYTAAEKASLTLAKLTFVLLNLVAMGGGLYKMSTMGLLPTTSSDWTTFLGVAPSVQFSTGSRA